MRELAVSGASLLGLIVLTAGGQAPAARGDTLPTASFGKPPTVLADGTRSRALPVAVRRFSPRPIVGATRIRTGVPATPCAREQGVRFATAWLSPEGVSVVFTRGRGHVPLACDVVRVRGRWRLCSFGVARSSDPARIARAGGALGLCRRARQRRAFVWVPTPARSAWALAARRGYWVAYPTSGVRLVRVSGTEGIERDQFRATVVFLDARGRVVERRRVVGYVAG